MPKEDKPKYLNGFTILSFNHNNKYVTMKSENYFFDNTVVTSNKIKLLNSIKLDDDTTSESSQIKKEYWIVEDEFGNFKIQISTNPDISLTNVIAGPVYDERSALALFEYFDTLES